MKLLHLISLGLLAMIAATPASSGAAAVTLNSPAGAFDGTGFSLGWQFTLNQAITVRTLGQFDSSQNGFAQPVAIGIYDLAGNLLTSASLAAGQSGTLDGFFRYTPIAPLTLAEGATYVIGSYHEDLVLRTDFGSSFTLSPDLRALEWRVAEANGLAFPSSTGNPTTEPQSVGNAYLGPNFQYDVVPEPSAALLLSGGVLAMIARRQRARFTA